MISALPSESVVSSPSLSLYHAIAVARLGSHSEGAEWADRAIEGARLSGDSVVEVRAYNVRGAIAFESGQIEDSEDFFQLGLAGADRVGDKATVGRCSNNLANIAYMRGDFGRALGSYIMAMAAFQHAGLDQGVAEAWHNVAAVHRDRGDLTSAREAAERGVEAAYDSGDLALVGQTLAGRAEIRMLSGDARFAAREISRAIAIHKRIGDVVREAEDSRIEALIMLSLGETNRGVAQLQKVQAQAEEHGRPYLGALASRDLALALQGAGNLERARRWAHSARVAFERLGARYETGQIDALLSDLY